MSKSTFYKIYADHSFVNSFVVSDSLIPCGRLVVGLLPEKFNSESVIQ